MNSIDFIQDKPVVMAALERGILQQGVPVTNIEFAMHLFNCARDLCPFEDALKIYGYEEDEFSSQQVLSFKRCYNVGNAHIKRELTSRMLHATDPAEQSRTDNLLDRVFKLYVKEEDGGGNVNVTVNTTVSNKEEEVPEENKDVIVDNDIPEAVE